MGQEKAGILPGGVARGKKPEGKWLWDLKEQRSKSLSLKDCRYCGAKESLNLGERKNEHEEMAGIH